MNKEEKQIEEMVANIDAYIEGVDVRHWYSDELDEGLAKSLYNANYRKASEVAKEIFEEIMENSYPFGVNLVISKETLAELKKKRTEGENV